MYSNPAMENDRLQRPGGTIEARVLEGPPTNADSDENQYFLKVHTGAGTLVWKIDDDERKRLRNTAEHPQPLGRKDVVL